jgi:cell fate regulator YaaT (PSP1 superfamily)
MGTFEQDDFKDAEDKEEYGVGKYSNRDAIEEDKILFTSKILRKATANDIQKVDSHIELSRAAIKKCKEVVEKLGLLMNVFRAGYSFDGNRLQFMFTSDDRVDFRDLVKELAKTLQKQINLRQIGPRDRAKMIGRPLCCSQLGKLKDQHGNGAHAGTRKQWKLKAFWSMWKTFVLSKI